MFWMTLAALALAEPPPAPPAGPVIPTPECPDPLGLAAFRGPCGLPRDTREAQAWLTARAGPRVKLPPDLVAIVTPSAHHPELGVRILDGRRIGDEAMLIIERDSLVPPPGGCSWRHWSLSGARRQDGQWIGTGSVPLTGYLPIRCLVTPGARVSASCEVRWDGGEVTALHAAVRCPEGSIGLTFRGQRSCVALEDCRYVAPLPWGG